MLRAIYFSFVVASPWSLIDALVISSLWVLLQSLLVDVTLPKSFSVPKILGEEIGALQTQPQRLRIASIVPTQRCTDAWWVAHP